MGESAKENKPNFGSYRKEEKATVRSAPDGSDKNAHLIQIEHISGYKKTPPERVRPWVKLCVILLSSKSGHFTRFCNPQPPLLAVKEKSRE